MLDIVANYHRIQFQGKCMIQTQKNGEKPRFGPGLQFFFQKFGFFSHYRSWPAIIMYNIRKKLMIHS